ncbi:MAG: YitT family protein [Bacilli bacterium]|jgi:uncharacterized membrane-anchored protein YitT (DUF2179 family)|nr:YitT family protein [Bacilli bacterium]MDY0064563.1 YitT family protein [Bacilli bacterium]
MKWNKNKVKEVGFITLGVMLSSFSFSFFLSPKNFVIGGASGIGTLLFGLFGWDPALTILIINIILLFVGLFFLGKEFFLKTVYGTLLYPVFIKGFDLLYQWLQPNPINDHLLIIIFAAIIMGFGLGIVIKYGATTGGTEIPQNILLKYFHIPYSVSLYLIDGIVVICSIFVFHDFSLILYGIIFIYLSGFVIDQVVFSGFNKRAVSIISTQAEQIKERILVDLGRGVTQIRVLGGYTNSEKNKLICVLSTFEFYRLKKIIHQYDPDAFYYAVRADEVSGEGFTYGK